MKIAITGGIGSGKSAAANFIKELGFPVFSCDEIYANLCTEPEFLNELSARFPGCVRAGKLLREALSARVFSDEAAREKLNSFTHPIIFKRLEEAMRPFPTAFAEVPLLFESGAEKKFDFVLVLLREREARVKSLLARGLTKAEIERRMARQFDYSAYFSAASKGCGGGALEPLGEGALQPLGEGALQNFILILNDGTLFELQTRIKAALKKLI